MKLRTRFLVSSAALAALLGLLIRAADSARLPTDPVRTAPQIERLEPSSLLAGSPPFVLTVVGAFIAGDSVVRWNDENRPTTIEGSGLARAAIPAADVAAAGSARVTVLTPSLTGGRPSVSSAQNFRIRAANSFETP
jgi:hypothetical protein